MKWILSTLATLSLAAILALGSPVCQGIATSPLGVLG